MSYVLNVTIGLMYMVTLTRDCSSRTHVYPISSLRVFGYLLQLYPELFQSKNGLNTMTCFQHGVLSLVTCYARLEPCNIEVLTVYFSLYTATIVTRLSRHAHTLILNNVIWVSPNNETSIGENKALLPKNTLQNGNNLNRSV